MLSSTRYLALGGLVLIGAALIADEKKSLPKGSEKAVAAVRKAFPDAEIDEATEPKGFGGSGGKGEPMFWIVRFRTKMKRELSVLPDGTIIRFPIPVEAKDLPKAVADGVARAAPGAKILDAEKN